LYKNRNKMQFIEFRNKFKNQYVFSKKDIEKLFPAYNKMNLVNWQKKGHITRIRNSWYCFSEINEIKSYNLLIANKIYKPSYVSLETALSFYGFIPEAVFLTTSVSSRKTIEFDTKLGVYSYKSIKENLFFGYKLLDFDKSIIKIAEPEKAILDFLYLKKSVNNINDITALRLNKNEIKLVVDFKKLHNYTSLFNSKKLDSKVKLLEKYIYA